MRHKQIVKILFAGMVMLTLASMNSCDKQNNDNKKMENLEKKISTLTKKIQELREENQNYKSTIDSIKKDPQAATALKLEELCTAVSNFTEVDMPQLLKDVENAKENAAYGADNSYYGNGGLWALGIALLLLNGLPLGYKAFTRRKKTSSSTTSIAEIEESKKEHNDIEALLSKESIARQNLESKVDSLEDRIKQMQTQLQSLQSLITKSLKPEEPKPLPPKPNPRGKTAYFGSAIGEKMFGKEYSEYLQGACIYECSISGDIAEYQPIDSIEAVRTYNHMDCAVDFRGVPRQIAKTMKIEEKGLAQRKGSAWIVTKKAIVKLS